MASEERRAAGFDIPQGPQLTGPQAITEACAIHGAVETEDVRHFQHRDLWGNDQRPCMSWLSGSVRVARASHVRWVQIWVVRALPRPRLSWMMRRLTPASSKWVVETAAGDRAAVVGEAVRQTVTGRRGEQPHRGAMPAPESAEHPEGRLGHTHRAQSAAHFLAAQHHRQFLLAGRPDQPQGGPWALKRLLVEELDPAQGDGSGGAGGLLLVGQVQKVVAEMFPGELVRTGAIVFGQLADGGHIALLGSCREPPQLHTLNHPLTQR